MVFSSILNCSVSVFFKIFLELNYFSFLLEWPMGVKTTWGTGKMPKPIWCHHQPGKSKKALPSRSLRYQTLFGVSDVPLEVDLNYLINVEEPTGWTKMLKKMGSYLVSTYMVCKYYVRNVYSGVIIFSMFWRTNRTQKI